MWKIVDEQSYMFIRSKSIEILSRNQEHIWDDETFYAVHCLLSFNVAMCRKQKTRAIIIFAFISRFRNYRNIREYDRIYYFQFFSSNRRSFFVWKLFQFTYVDIQSSQIISKWNNFFQIITRQCWVDDYFALITCGCCCRCSQHVII